MLKRALFTSLVVVCLFVSASGAGQPKVTPVQRAFIKKTLDSIKPYDLPTYNSAVKAITHHGAGILPAIAEAAGQRQGQPYQSNWPLQALMEAKADIRLHRDSRAAVEKWIAAHDKAQNSGTLIYISCDDASEVFPNYAFYSFVFPQWPLELIPPKPFSAANIFAVRSDGHVMLLATPDDLKEFFREHVKPDRKPSAEERTLKTDTLAWLCLTSTFSSDGYFQFTVDSTSVTVGKAGLGWQTTGKDEVVPLRGDRGEIDATLSFKLDGTFIDASETRSVEAGIRPICQATKLLDPDPIVRRMATRDLLVIGPAARPYLDIQREKATPELQKAIDALWEQILDRERKLYPVHEINE